MMVFQIGQKVVLTRKYQTRQPEKYEKFRNSTFIIEIIMPTKLDSTMYKITSGKHSLLVEPDEIQLPIPKRPPGERMVDYNWYEQRKPTW